MPARLRIARAIGKREEAVAYELVSQVKQREVHDAHGRPPPFASDGLPHYRQALIEVYGEVPPYPGRGRPPTKKRPTEELRYGQLVKRRRSGRLVEIEERIVFGDPEEVKAALGGKVSTSHVERDNSTARRHNGRLTRKTLGYAKTVAALEAACAWTDLVYNFQRPHKELRERVFGEEPGRKWARRTPGMAAGLTDHIWSVAELLTYVPMPPNIINN